MVAERIATSDIEPIEAFVTADGAPLTGLLPGDLVVRIRRQSDGAYFDWDSAALDFKTSAWTTRDKNLIEQDATLNPGVYEVVGGFDTSTIVGISADDRYTVIILQVAGAPAVLPPPGELKVGQWVDDTLQKLRRVLGLLHQNAIIDNQAYSSGQLTSARLRIFDIAANVPSTPGGSEIAGLLFEYQFTATYDGNNLQDMFLSKVVL